MNLTHPRLHARQGFTLLEIVLVISMISVLLGITVVVAGNMNWREDVDEAADLIEAAFTEALVSSRESMEDCLVELRVNGVMVQGTQLELGRSPESLGTFPNSVQLEWQGKNLGSEESLYVRISSVSLLQVPELKLVGEGRIQVGTTDPVSGGIVWR